MPSRRKSLRTHACRGLLLGAPPACGGLLAQPNSALCDEPLDAVRLRVGPRAGADDGSLRSDVSADDVVSSLLGIFLASDSPEQTGRLLDLLVAGVATTAVGE